MRFQSTAIAPFGVLIEPNGLSQDVRDVSIEALRELLSQEQLLILRGFEALEDADDLSEYSERWGQVSIWPFGKVLNLVEHDDPTDHIFDSNYVPLHWDGMYRPQVPELQIFYCVTAPRTGEGGRTIFSNTIRVLNQAPREARVSWGKVTGIYERSMEFYNSKTVSPLVTRHPYRDLDVIRYNEPVSRDEGDFLNPPDLEFTGLDDAALECVHSSLKDALYAPSCFYAHEWQEGDIVIADNFSLLHGRESFSTKTPRHLQRVHVLSDPPLDNPGLETYRCPGE